MTIEPATRHRSKALRRCLVGVSVLGLLLLGARLTLPTGLNLWLTSLLTEQLNLDLTIEDIEIDLAAGHVRLSGIEASVDGTHLASVPMAEASLDVWELVTGLRGTIAIDFHDLVGELHVVKGGGLNVAAIGSTDSADATPEDAGETQEDAARLYLDLQADNAKFTIHDVISDPGNPLTIEIPEAWVGSTQIVVSGPDRGANLTDVYCLGALGDRKQPALFAIGFWEGEQPEGTYMELHAAITGMDIRKAPQWVTPNAGRILGGNVVHASGTAIAHKDAIDQGVVEIEVEGSSTTLELRFGGPLGAPVFDRGSPVLQVFRLGYLRLEDSGSSLLSGATSLGKSLWDRTSGVFTHTARGVSDAVTELSIRKLGSGIWKGVSGLFVGNGDDDSAEELKKRWTRWAQRQLEFRRLYMERRLEVAKKLEPQRVPHYEKQLADTVWAEEVNRLIPAGGRPDIAPKRD